MRKLLTETMLFLFLLSLAIVLPKAMAQSKEKSSDDLNKKIFEAKCQKCHSMERIKEAHLTLEKAKETVEKMRKKEGANISKVDANSIYDYLGKYFVVPPSPAAVPPSPR